LSKLLEKGRCSTLFCFVFEKQAAILEEEKAVKKLREEGESARISLGKLGRERTDFALKMKEETETLAVERLR
jgi:hypothetical protein